ncbi:MAG TPA: TIR domain-containing protein [Hyphomonadaceae bacterium]|nr:TIR domain-containing protein [Hyphomonadaceae bacterium]
MTDIYIAYAREDRERIRPIAEMLQFEGWDVWWDPSAPTLDSSAAVDQKLGSAGAILVVWSGYSRGSEHVRSEAATGLYKNKLIQARIDTASPPRPFDQVEVVNLAGWRGEREDPEWRRVVASIRLYAGQPNAARQQQQAGGAKKLAFPKLMPSKPAYVENDRSVAWVPMVAAGVLVLSAGGVFMLDPFGWRGGGEIRSAEAETPNEEAAEVSPRGAAAVAPQDILDTAQSDAAWEAVDRKDIQALRDYANEYPRSSNTETARSLLRVLDAQAWVEAVTTDNEAGYSNYLKNFPVNGSVPGAMAMDARDRLVALSAERTQAIEQIQRGLLALSLYEGEIDGKASANTVAGMRKFASQKRRNAPSLTSSAPRDLRTFGDLIEKTAVDAGLMKPSAQTPVLAAATTNAKPTSAPTSTATTPAAAAPPRPQSVDAEVADRDRIARAQEAADAAAKKEEERKKTEALQVAALSKLDATAWADAQRAGTVAAYQSYLASYPNGTQAVAARSAISRLTRPAAYSLDSLSPAVRTAAEAARRAKEMASSRAAAGRQAASDAQAATGLRTITASNGDRYETQIQSGAPNGLGTRLSGDIRTAGDRYRGEIRGGKAAGVGVYEYSDNPGNRSNLARYEGEHNGDGAAGYGVTYWKNGDNFAGQDTGGVARGVISFGSGQRYEGEMRNGARNGLGVVWSADGQMLQAGRWENNQLVEPLSGGAISLTPNNP